MGALPRAPRTTTTTGARASASQTFRSGAAVLGSRRFFGESHSPVVHELWVLVVVGSNPTSPTHTTRAAPQATPLIPRRARRW
jgi:hypothetical protein